MTQVQKLLTLEKTVVDLKLKLEEHVRYLYRELQFNSDTDTVSLEEFNDMVDRVEAEVMRMEKTVKDRLGELLLNALEISKGALEEMK